MVSLNKEYALRVNLVRNELPNKTFKEKVLYSFQRGIYTQLLYSMLTGRTKEWLRLPQQNRIDKHQIREVYVGTKQQCKIELNKYDKRNYDNLIKNTNNIRNHSYFRHLDKKLRQKIQNSYSNLKQTKLEQLKDILLLIGIQFYLDVDIKQ